MTAIRPWQVWRWHFAPILGHEQDGTRSGLVVSSPFHLQLTGGKLVNVVPVTSRERLQLLHRVGITAPDGTRLWVVTEQVRSMSVERIDRTKAPWRLSPVDVAEVRRVFQQMVDL